MGSTRPVHIYVDGSCGENRNVTSDTKAGWGFCVISDDTGSGNGKGNLLTESFGHVVTNPDEEGFLGAEVGSNNTAELSAIAHALLITMTVLTAIYFRQVQKKPNGILTRGKGGEHE